MHKEEVQVSAYVQIRRGRVVDVRGHSSKRLIADRAAKSVGTGHCKKCGAQVQIREMPNGGFGVFDLIPGIRSIKHPCYSLGDHLGKANGIDTMDLFEWAEDVADSGNRLSVGSGPILD